MLEPDHKLVTIDFPISVHARKRLCPAEESLVKLKEITIKLVFQVREVVFSGPKDPKLAAPVQSI